jgi:hypothetical protein
MLFGIVYVSFVRNVYTYVHVSSVIRHSMGFATTVGTSTGSPYLYDFQFDILNSGSIIEDHEIKKVSRAVVMWSCGGDSGSSRQHRSTLYSWLLLNPILLKCRK